MSTKRDFYEILGVSKGSSQEEIKKAYRKVAMQFHPDRNPGDKASEEKFKEAAEAYEILNDTDKRAQYDRFGHNAFGQGRSGGGHGGAGMNMDDIFSQFGDIFGEDSFGSFFGGGGRRGGGGETNQTPVILTQPSNVIMVNGNSSIITVSASGESLSYQWQVDSGSGFANISDSIVYAGSATASLTITNATVVMNGYKYRVVINGTYAQPATSNSATLSVTAPTTAIIKLSTANVPLGTLIGGVQVSLILPEGVKPSINPIKLCIQLLVSVCA